jgi:hypothetical protein
MGKVVPELGSHITAAGSYTLNLPQICLLSGRIIRHTKRVQGGAGKVILYQTAKRLERHSHLKSRIGEEGGDTRELVMEKERVEGELLQQAGEWKEFRSVRARAVGVFGGKDSGG